jgi:nitrous oxide reductase accessory protein NosL
MIKFLLLCIALELFGLTTYPQYSQAIKTKKIYPMGEKIYNARCHNQSFSHYNSYEELYDALNNTQGCATLSPRYKEAVALYLWDRKLSHKNSKKQLPKLTVTHKDKCPVCGMFLYKYPHWVSRIEYGAKSYSFDGIKDMMKFYFTHKEGISNIFIQDYYTLKTLDATKAYFVIGSDVYGPMGDELIGFDTLESAKRFMLDHRGKKIFRFEQITPEIIKSLDA